MSSLSILYDTISKVFNLHVPINNNNVNISNVVPEYGSFNSSVDIIGDPHSVYQSRVNFKYNRINLSKLLGAGDTFVIITNDDLNKTQLIEYINNSVKTKLFLTDFHSFDMPLFTVPNKYDLTLLTNSKSYLYYGKLKISILYKLPENYNSLHVALHNILPGRYLRK